MRNDEDRDVGYYIVVVLVAAVAASAATAATTTIAAASAVTPHAGLRVHLDRDSRECRHVNHLHPFLYWRSTECKSHINTW